MSDFESAPIGTLKQLADAIAERDALREALEDAREGLSWFHDRHPLEVDECDHEAMARIDAALALGAHR